MKQPYYNFYKATTFHNVRFIFMDIFYYYVMKIILLNFIIFSLSFFRCYYGSSFLFSLIPRYLYSLTIGICKICSVFYSQLLSLLLFPMNIIALFYLFKDILCVFDHFSILFITSLAYFTFLHKHAKSSANAKTPWQLCCSSLIRLSI